MSKKDKSDKKQALNKAMDQIKREHGQGSIMWLGENETMDVNVIPTGILNIDIALGVGGIPRGRITEIYGNESSGKTTLGLHIVAEAQKRGGTAVFVDVEHALDPNYAQNLGVNIDELLVSQPDNGEQALEIVEALIRSSAVDVIVIDSVAALVPKTELEGEMGDSHVALQARLMSQALRKLSGAISESQAACVFINQIREKVGVKFGNPETTSGGRALKFYTTVRIELKRSKTIKDGDETIGSKVNIKVIKNKVAPPFRDAQCDIMYGTGISKEAGIIDIGVETEIIEKNHSWYSFDEQRLGQGRENVKEFLRENPEIYKEIENKIRKKAGLEIEDDENVKKEQAK